MTSSHCAIKFTFGYYCSNNAAIKINMKYHFKGVYFNPDFK